MGRGQAQRHGQAAGSLAQDAPWATIRPLAYQGRCSLRSPSGRGLRTCPQDSETRRRWPKRIMRDVVVHRVCTIYSRRVRRGSAAGQTEADGTRDPAACEVSRKGEWGRDSQSRLPAPDHYFAASGLPRGGPLSCVSISTGPPGSVRVAQQLSVWARPRARTCSVADHRCGLARCAVTRR